MKLYGYSRIGRDNGNACIATHIIYKFKRWRWHKVKLIGGSNWIMDDVYGLAADNVAPYNAA